MAEDFSAPDDPVAYNRQIADLAASQKPAKEDKGTNVTGIFKDVARALMGGALGFSASDPTNPRANFAAAQLADMQNRRATAQQVKKANELFHQMGVVPESVTVPESLIEPMAKRLLGTQGRVQKLGKPGEAYLDAQGNIQTVPGTPTTKPPLKAESALAVAIADPTTENWERYRQLKAFEDQQIAQRADEQRKTLAYGASLTPREAPYVLVKGPDGQLAFVPNVNAGAAPTPAAGQAPPARPPAGSAPAAPTTGPGGVITVQPPFKPKADKDLSTPLSTDAMKGIVWRKPDGSRVTGAEAKDRGSALVLGAFPLSKDEERQFTLYDGVAQRADELAKLFPLVKDTIGVGDWPTWIGAKGSQAIRSARFAAFAKNNPVGAKYLKRMVELNLEMTKSILPQARIPVWDQQLLMGKNLDPTMNAETQASQILDIKRSAEESKKRAVGYGTSIVRGITPPPGASNNYATPQELEQLRREGFTDKELQAEGLMP